MCFETPMSVPAYCTYFDHRYLPKDSTPLMRDCLYRPYLHEISASNEISGRASILSNVVQCVNQAVR